MTPSLESLDPVAEWRPWRPTSADPWSRTWAAHLYRRAGFGANRAELLEAERLGPEGTLELLLTARDPGDLTQRSQDDGARLDISRNQPDERLRTWWLYQMLRGGHPLREKMTLFWHNHFATSIAKVQSAAAMFEQNQLLRRHALGKFGPFLHGIGTDSAMLLWLDSNSNVKAHPNENYGRELMELFSLGVGNYTEKDVREAARSFTGWHTKDGRFRFVGEDHDDGVKTVLGQTGNWDGGDIVRIVLEQPAAARFLVRKLYGFLVNETVVPPVAFLELLCERFRKSDYDIRDLVRTMLASRHFYSEHAFRKRIKAPVEYVVGAVRAVYREYEEDDADYRPLPHQVLDVPITAMGQKLFAPPNVKGWPGGRAWLNTSTVLERDNFAAALATGSLWSPQRSPTVVAKANRTNKDGVVLKAGAPEPAEYEYPPPPKALDPARLVEEERATTPEAIVRALLDHYVPGGIRPEAQARLVAFVGDGRPTGPRLAARVREAVHVILAMPEYQLA